jgi:nanoRNase/pAp phosphatase (c-di-AMP/oligoRNAs hydrolase)
MVRRLVLGCDTLGHAVIEAVAARPGAVRVIDDDEGRVDTLRNEGILADHGDPADPDLLAAGKPPDLVLVAGDDARGNVDAARAAREVFPDAHLIAYTGPGVDDVTRARLGDLVDRTIDHVGTIAAAVLSAGDRGEERLRALKRVLGSITGRLGVFTHNDPDPDAIASALALRDIARAQGVDAVACYFGEITHQENRALVNLLDLDLTRLDRESFDPEAFDGVALVDHSRPGINDDLSPETPVDVVIDHHPSRGPVEAPFVDLRSDVGATSTLLVDYLEGLDLEIDPAVATALLYGIRVDTRDFTREITARDFEAAAVLLPQADMGVLERVESPSIGGDTLDTIGRAIKDYDRRGSIVVSSVGTIVHRDAIAQAADQLLAMDGVTLTVVSGFMDGTVYVSGRTRGTTIDVGETMRRAFAEMGSAGGHADMAGAQLPIGILGRLTDEDESLESVVTEVITARLFDELDLGRLPSRPPRENHERRFEDSSAP